MKKGSSLGFTQQLHYFVTIEEKAWLEQQAKQNQTTISKYIRKLISNDIAIKTQLTK